MSGGCHIKLGAARKHQHSNGSQRHHPHAAGYQIRCYLIHSALSGEPVSDHDPTITAGRRPLRGAELSCSVRKNPPTPHYLGPSTRKLCSLWIDSDRFGASDRAFMFDGDRVEHKRNWSGTGHRRNTSIGCLRGDCWIRNPHHVEPSADRLANQLVDRSRRPRFGISPIRGAFYRVPMLRQIHPRSREAAALLGSSQFRIRREIDLPLVARGLTVAAGFAFAISIGEFGATSFFASTSGHFDWTASRFRLLSTPGDLLRGQAMALSVVLALAVATAVIFSELLSVRRSRSRKVDLPIGS